MAWRKLGGRLARRCLGGLARRLGLGLGTWLGMGLGRMGRSLESVLGLAGLLL